MLNKITLFLLLTIIWLLGLFLGNKINVIYIVIGIFFSLLTTAFVFRLSIIDSRIKNFLFLQITLYSYIFIKITDSINNVFKASIQLINPKMKFTSILDYVFIKKESDTEMILTANILTILPGTIGILMKKNYLVVHSLDKNYFSLSNMYNLNNEVSKIDDDCII